MTSNPVVHGIYKSSIIDSQWEDIKALRMSVYKDNEEVFFIVFNAESSTKTNWFSFHRVIGSSSSQLVNIDSSQVHPAGDGFSLRGLHGHASGSGAR